MTDFKIRRGRSDQLFIDGQVNQKLVIEEGCWYLCSDTAELYLGVLDEATNTLCLKRVNSGVSSADGPIEGPGGGNHGGQIDGFEELEFAVSALQDDVSTLQSDVADLKEAKLIKEIGDLSELPAVNDAEFSFNTIYYLKADKGSSVSAYIYDVSTAEYLCISSTLYKDDVYVVKAEINASGELIVYYSNGDSYTLGNITNNDYEGAITAIKIGDTTYASQQGVIDLSDTVATKDFVADAIAEAQLEGKDVDLSSYAKKEDLTGFASEQYVNEKIAAIEHPAFPAGCILLGGDASPDDD